MSNKSNDKLVGMHAVFKTVDSDETRERTITYIMNETRILGAPTLDDAIEYFKSKVQSIDSIEDFSFFIIDDKTYEADFWI